MLLLLLACKFVNILLTTFVVLTGPGFPGKSPGGFYQPTLLQDISQVPLMQGMGGLQAVGRCFDEEVTSEDNCQYASKAPDLRSILQIGSTLCRTRLS